MSRYQDRDSDVAARLTYFIVGATVGAVVALLFAPKAGRELREDLADATRKGVDRARETGSQISAKAGEYYDTASARASELARGAPDAATTGGERSPAPMGAGRRASREEKSRPEPTGDEPLALDSGQA